MSRRWILASMALLGGMAVAIAAIVVVSAIVGGAVFYLQRSSPEIAPPPLHVDGVAVPEPSVPVGSPGEPLAVVIDPEKPTTDATTAPPSEARTAPSTSSGASRTSPTTDTRATTSKTRPSGEDVDLLEDPDETGPSPVEEKDEATDDQVEDIDALLETLERPEAPAADEKKRGKKTGR